MDAEKFDKVVMDLLYDELDELTHASALRHMEQSGRAKALYSELRATREVGALPLVEPPEDLAERILAAEALARADRPLRQRLGAMVSIAASYAMRPQLGMAALLLLMVGSSLLLLRVKPGEPSSVQVTERGVPESDRESVALPVPQPEAPVPALDKAPAAVETHAASRARAVGRAEEATENDSPSDGEPLRAAPANGAEKKRGTGNMDALSAFGAPPAAPAPAGQAAGAIADDAPALPSAKKDKAGAADDASGCAAALPHYESVAAAPPSPAAGNAARFAAADCYARLGRRAKARAAYAALLTVPDYAARAKQALNDLSSELPTPAPSARETSKPAAEP